MAAGLLFDLRMRIALLVLVGCADPVATPASYPAGAELVPNADGYVLASRIAMPLGGPAVAAAVAQLQQFSGKTLLARAGASLPASTAGYIDAAIPADVRARILDIGAMASTITSGFTLESNLTISPTGALHGLTALEFRPDGLDVVVPIGGLDADAITQHPTAEVGAGGALEVGDETFTLALGDHAWHALELAVQSRDGGDVASAARVDCNAVATAVAAHVGHASDVLAACQLGTSALVGDLSAALAPIALDAHFIAGTAQLVDADGDGIADSLAGTWQAENDVGSGATSMEIAFKSQP